MGGEEREAAKLSMLFGVSILPPFLAILVLCESKTLYKDVSLEKGESGIYRVKCSRYCGTVAIQVEDSYVLPPGDTAGYPSIYAGQVDDKIFVSNLCSEEGEEEGSTGTKSCSFNPIKHYFYIKVKANRDSTNAVLKITGKHVNLAYKLIPTYKN